MSDLATLAMDAHEGLDRWRRLKTHAAAWPVPRHPVEGTSVVIDVSNLPSFEETAVMNFFTTSTRNLLAYEAAAGVPHHVALSVVETDRLLESGYFRAKMAQEKLIKSPPSRTRSFTQRSSSSSSRASGLASLPS